MESGLDAALRTIHEPPSPALATFDLRSISAEFGRSTSSMTCDPSFADHAGMLPMGAVAMLADSVLARTLLTCMPPGLVVATGRGQLSMISGTPAGTELLAHGRVVTWDHDSGITSADILDAAGVLVAQATARCYAVPGKLGVPLMAPGTNGTHGTSAARPGADFLGLEWTPETEAGSTVTARLTATARLESMYGSLHGGATAAVLEATLGRAVADRATNPLDLEIHYLRPAPAAGAALLTRGRVVHATRRFTLGSAELVDDTGRLLASATATYGASTPRCGEA